MHEWLIFSLILLGIWFVIFLVRPFGRKESFWVSLFTMPIGLTEPLFVPAYWNPPSLFDLASRTGFDIESLIFAFGIGGLAVVIYEKIFRVEHKQMSVKEKHLPRHKFHLLVLFSAPIIFIILLLFTNLNPIYSTFIALMGGGFATWYCRPDLKKKMLVSAFIFTILYFVYFLTLIVGYPDYVQQVWNLSALSGILIIGIPL